eukprot:scaffold3250_cov105-Cylindrotheca_fusiformis.AAC.3
MSQSPTSDLYSLASFPRSDQRSQQGHDSRFSCNICLEAVVEPVVTHCGHLYCWPCLYRWLEPGMQPEERASLGLAPAFTFDNSRRVCPVCKSPCSTPSLVPIYVRCEDPASEKYSSEVESVHQEDKDTDGDAENDDEGVDSGHQSQSRDASDHSTTVETAPETGLRQRHVPSRPAATSPRSFSHPQSPTTPQHRNGNYMMSLSPNGHRASLSHGIMLTFQQATSSAVPPLHRRGGGDSPEMDAHFNGTEYLSRISATGGFQEFKMIAYFTKNEAYESSVKHP